MWEDPAEGRLRSAYVTRDGMKRSHGMRLAGDVEQTSCHLVRWAWRQHLDDGGEECPWLDLI